MVQKEPKKFEWEKTKEEGEPFGEVRKGYGLIEVKDEIVTKLWKRKKYHSETIEHVIQKMIEELDSRKYFAVEREKMLKDFESIINKLKKLEVVKNVG